MTTVVLNVKIDAELTEKLLQLAFQLEESAGEAGVTEEDIDSQHTEEEATPLTPKEIKALRKLLKKKK